MTTLQTQTVTRFVTSVQPFSAENRERYKKGTISDAVLDSFIFMVIATAFILILSLIPGGANPSPSFAGTAFAAAVVSAFTARLWDGGIARANLATAQKHLTEIRPDVLAETGVNLPDSFADALSASWYMPRWTLDGAVITVNESGALVVETSADNLAPVG